MKKVLTAVGTSFLLASVILAGFSPKASLLLAIYSSVVLLVEKAINAPARKKNNKYINHTFYNIDLTHRKG